MERCVYLSMKKRMPAVARDVAAPKNVTMKSSPVRFIGPPVRAEWQSKSFTLAGGHGALPTRSGDRAQSTGNRQRDLSAAGSGGLDRVGIIPGLGADQSQVDGVDALG